MSGDIWFRFLGLYVIAVLLLCLGALLAVPIWECWRSSRIRQRMLARQFIIELDEYQRRWKRRDD